MRTKSLINQLKAKGFSSESPEGKPWLIKVDSPQPPTKFFYLGYSMRDGWQPCSTVISPDEKAIHTIAKAFNQAGEEAA